jgi:hypothetical protein
MIDTLIKLYFDWAINQCIAFNTEGISLAWGAYRSRFCQLRLVFVDTLHPANLNFFRQPRSKPKPKTEPTAKPRKQH